MGTLRGHKILVTGPAGQIAFPLARALARDNEVWGTARFSQPGSRERVEQIGVTTRVVDLAAPDWSELPLDFDYVLHLAASIVDGFDVDTAIRINAEGTGELMSRFRRARAILVMSSCAVYASPDDGHHAIAEDFDYGGSPQPYSNTYCVSKLAEEAVARFAAREFGVPTTIARMNVAYGDNGGLPAMLLDSMLSGQPIPLRPGRASICSPIHEDDIIAQTPALLAAAAVPAAITNWGGDQAVDLRDMVHDLGELSGCEPRLEESQMGIHHYRLDPTRRIELAGNCQVDWRDGLRRMVTARQRS
ncbi:MAG: NAD(P)-dependent oxidoreductase [Myxococcota bacterium]|nr:NAD(P)-dependent oxidoreductase [Myxococcota bacterium]